MRRVLGRICREKDMNLQLHLQHLSEEVDLQDEWMFVESRPIQSGAHNVCPCGQTPIHSFFFLENKINGNRTFVGSECIRNIDPKAAAVIGYFKHILENEVQGIYKGQDNQGLQTFAVKSNTILHLPFCRANLRKFSVSLQGPTYYNSIGNDIKESNSLHLFKTKLKKKMYMNY